MFEAFFLHKTLLPQTRTRFKLSNEMAMALNSIHLHRVSVFKAELDYVFVSSVFRVLVVYLPVFWSRAVSMH